MNDTEFRLILNERLCDLADALLLHYNPCQIEDGRCIRARTLDTEMDCCQSRHFARFNERSECPFLRNGRCSVRRISCKTWFCETAIRGMDQECFRAFQVIETLEKLYELGTRPFLGERYVGKAKELAHL